MTSVPAQETDPIRILALSGSLREASLNRRLVRLAAALAPDGVELVTFDGLDAVEPYHGDVEESEGFPPGARAFVEAIRDVDGLFIATPEYNGSVPGQLKNALDWASRPDGAVDAAGLQGSPTFGVPVAVASASTGQFGALWARDELAKILRTQGARPITEPSVTIANGADAFAEDGTLRNAAAMERLEGLLAQLATTVRQLRAARAAQAAPAPAAG